jgi:hypothetical protein
MSRYLRTRQARRYQFPAPTNRTQLYACRLPAGNPLFGSVGRDTIGQLDYAFTASG